MSLNAEQTSPRHVDAEGVLAPRRRTRGALRNAAVARPFMKWVGGKGRLLGQYAELFPRQFAR
ncbi:MAG: hypothetical protein KC609_18490, partial [Myxococcales bacterium]|nr:hypothetical protein [Myxococcales bacterium]